MSKKFDEVDSNAPLVDKNKYLRPELRYCITHEDAVRLLGLSEKDVEGITINQYCYPDGLIVHVLPPEIKQKTKKDSEVVVNPTNGILESNKQEEE